MNQIQSMDRDLDLEQFADELASSAYVPIGQLAALGIDIRAIADALVAIFEACSAARLRRHQEKLARNPRRQERRIAKLVRSGRTREEAREMVRLLLSANDDQFRSLERLQEDVEDGGDDE